GTLHLSGLVSIHARSLRGLATHAHYCASDVVVLKGCRSGGATPARVGLGCLGQHRCGTSLQGPDRRSVSVRLGFPLFALYTAVIPERDLAAARAGLGHFSPAGHRGAVAHPRDTAESAVSVLQHAQRTRQLSRLLLVLFFQRAYPSILKPPLPARLQYRSAAVLLVV